MEYSAGNPGVALSIFLSGNNDEGDNLSLFIGKQAIDVATVTTRKTSLNI
jgi:hypothetical protein